MAETTRRSVLTSEISEEAFTGTFTGNVLSDQSEVLQGMPAHIGRVSIICAEQQHLSPDERRGFLYGVALTVRAVERGETVTELIRSLAESDIRIEKVSPDPGAENVEVRPPAA